MRDRDDAEGLLLDDRYEVGTRIGAGGSAVVHRAWDRERRREVAVKLLPPGTTATSRAGRAEADILGALDHPHLVALHDVLTTGSGTALVMELVDGPSLAERLERGALSPAEAAVVLRDVAAGLAHAHRRGVVHRDVKPGNVLLRLHRGDVVEAKLSDFGIARLADATRTTADRTVVGTVRFLSPEQARGERATAASDVYSLGLTVLAALTGEEAFPGSPTESLAGRLLRAPALPDSLPEDWAELLRDMTALDPAERPDASATAALACTLGTGERAVVTASADERTRPIDLPFTAPISALTAPPRRRMGATAVLIASMAAVGVLLGAIGAVVLAPTAIEQALGGGAPETVAPGAPTVGAAPQPAVTRQPAPAPAATAKPADAEPEALNKEVAAQQSAAAPVAASDDRGRRGRDDSSGHGSGEGGGSSGHGSGHGSGGGHGSDD